MEIFLGVCWEFMLAGILFAAIGIIIVAWMFAEKF